MSEVHEQAPVIIRRFLPGDFGDIMELEDQAFGDRNPYIYMNLYELNPSGFLVAQAGQRLVGFVVGFGVSEDVGRIFSLAVHREYRGMGIGTALTEANIEYMRSEGVKKVTLEVRESNIMAQRLYRRLGFSEYGLAENYYNDGETAVLMEKEI